MYSKDGNTDGEGRDGGRSSSSSFDMLDSQSARCGGEDKCVVAQPSPPHFSTFGRCSIRSSDGCRSPEKEIALQDEAENVPWSAISSKSFYPITEDFIALVRDVATQMPAAELVRLAAGAGGESRVLGEATACDAGGNQPVPAVWASRSTMRSKSSTACCCSCHEDSRAAWACAKEFAESVVHADSDVIATLERQLEVERECTRTVMLLLGEEQDRYKMLKQASAAMVMAAASGARGERERARQVDHVCYDGQGQRESSHGWLRKQLDGLWHDFSGALGPISGSGREPTDVRHYQHHRRNSSAPTANCPVQGRARAATDNFHDAPATKRVAGRRGYPGAQAVDNEKGKESHHERVEFTVDTAIEAAECGEGHRAVCLLRLALSQHFTEWERLIGASRAYANISGANGDHSTHACSERQAESQTRGHSSYETLAIQRTWDREIAENLVAWLTNTQASARQASCFGNAASSNVMDQVSPSILKTLIHRFMNASYGIGWTKYCRALDASNEWLFAPGQGLVEEGAAATAEELDANYKSLWQQEVSRNSRAAPAYALVESLFQDRAVLRRLLLAAISAYPMQQSFYIALQAMTIVDEMPFRGLPRSDARGRVPSQPPSSHSATVTEAQPPVGNSRGPCLPAGLERSSATGDRVRGGVVAGGNSEGCTTGDTAHAWATSRSSQRSGYAVLPSLHSSPRQSWTYDSVMENEVRPTAARGKS